MQTEDSGVDRPRIITHLFVDGGRIIKSTRTDYSEHLGRPDMTAIVRRMMKDQHKAMFIALRDGQLDGSIGKVLEPAVPPAEALQSAPAAQTLEEFPRAAAPPPLPAKRKPRPPSPTLPEFVIAGEAQGADAADSSVPVPRQPAPTLTDLVLKDLESARSRGAIPGDVNASGRPVPKGATPVLGTPSMSRAPSGARYAASRPAAIFSAASPEQGSIFGGSSISEQSLDEVILSYLAEDLDASGDD